jgi:hypothetical protein
MVFHYKFHVSSVSLKVGKINKTTKTKTTLDIDITTLKQKAYWLLPPHIS